MNRRAFFGLGTKVVGAVTLGAHIALDKVGAQPTPPTIAANSQVKVVPGKHVIIDWMASYEQPDGSGNFCRSMPVQRGFYPPEQTTWDGRSYVRSWISPVGYSVFYVRA